MDVGWVYHSDYNGFDAFTTSTAGQVSKQSVSWAGDGTRIMRSEGCCGGGWSERQVKGDGTELAYDSGGSTVTQTKRAFDPRFPGGGLVPMVDSIITQMPGGRQLGV